MDEKKTSYIYEFDERKGKSPRGRDIQEEYIYIPVDPHLSESSIKKIVYSKNK